MVVGVDLGVILPELSGITKEVGVVFVDKLGINF